MKTATAPVIASTLSITTIIDAQINQKRNELARLEQIKALASGTEPEVTTAPRKRGRPRKGTAAAANASNGPKRPRGRPKGSKNKPKDSEPQTETVAVDQTPVLTEL